MRTAAVLCLIAICAHETPDRAYHYIVSGTVFDGCDAGQPAVGQRVRLVNMHWDVLAEDVSGTDGRFTLHPTADIDVKTKLYIDAGGRWTGLFDTYADWLQTGVYDGATVATSCFGRTNTPPFDGGHTIDDDVKLPSRPPPARLLTPTIRP